MQIMQAPLFDFEAFIADKRNRRSGGTEGASRGEAHRHSGEAALNHAGDLYKASVTGEYY